MATLLPYIPEEITVHLGSPSSSAQNVTVPFVDYIKNVASSEIYPTWEDSAIRANVLAQVSYALNRIYTEYYPSRGYDFNITASTAVDQKYTYGRNTFENVDRIVDEAFTSYIRRQGLIEPLAAKFCNGTTTMCEGLSQWGSQDLALQGYNSLDILKYYYGDDIEIVTNAPITEIQSFYPGTPLRLGDFGDDVLALQQALNTVREAYPAIPIIEPLNGVFDEATEAAVRKFQEIFSLTPDGIAGQATYNKIIYLYVGILRLAELASEGQVIFGFDLQFPEGVTAGSTGGKVSQIQLLINLLNEFIPLIPAVEMTGAYDDATIRAIEAFQRYEGIPITGEVDERTWDLLYQEYAGISRAVLNNQDLEATE